MSRITDAVKALAKMTWVKIPYVSSIEKYVATGDAAALSKIKPTGKQGNYWGYSLVEALRSPDAWQDEDRRIVHVAHAAAMVEYFWSWLDRQLATEKPAQDFMAPVLAALKEVKQTDSQALDQALLHVDHFVRDGRLTSAGRWAVSLPPEVFAKSIAKLKRSYRALPIADLVIAGAPDRLPSLVDGLLVATATGEVDEQVVKKLLSTRGAAFVPNILAAYQKCKGAAERFEVAEHLFDHDPKKFRDLAFDAAKAALADDEASHEHARIGPWLASNIADRAAPVFMEFFNRKKLDEDDAKAIVVVAAMLGKDALPLVLAGCDAGIRLIAEAEKAVKKDQRKSYYLPRVYAMHQTALDQLGGLGDAASKPRLLKEIRQGLAVNGSESVIGYLNLAGKWGMPDLQEDVWQLLGHKSKPVRESAARSLAKMGDAALPKAVELLGHKKADVRGATVSLLANIGTDKALAELEKRLDEEPNDDVRDQILVSLGGAWEKQGRVIGRKEIGARVAKAADAGKLKESPAGWLNVDKLPPLKWKADGKPLNKETVCYLLYRQSRASQMKPDLEAAPLYKLIDRASSGDFARTVLSGFLASKQEAGDRWALAVAGLLGDDRLVPEIVRQIRDWVDNNRGKLAEYAVQALALLGSDAALLSVDAMAIRYRSKMKNVGKAATEAFTGAAEHLGITPEELGDRVVPWLCFKPGEQRLVTAGKDQIEVTISPDLKLAFRDIGKNKVIKALPKTAPADVQAEFKEAAANLKEVVKAQLLRLENLLVRQRQWPAARWKELFLQHPVLQPFASRLVWAHYDANGRRLGTFRALMDRTLTTCEDDAYQLPDTGTVAMVHPLELSEEESLAWRNHLADYEVEPPFPQMERDVVTVKPEEAELKIWRELAGTSINAMTFKGRAERLGWYRGSVVDAGGIVSYYKTFPAAGVDVFLGVEDMYIGIDMYSDIKLGDVQYTRHGTVKVGSYMYDEPSEPNDPRLIALGDVPAIVFSEAMGDLRKIGGKKEAAQTEAM